MHHHPNPKKRKMMRKTVVVTCTILLCSTVQFCAAATGDSIAVGSSVTTGRNETHLISPGKIFELGFFTLGHRKYVGIWYYTWKPSAIVWVANRDQPVPDSATAFFGLENGALALSDSTGVSYFSASFGSLDNISTPTLGLFDSGNLVVRDDQSGRILWESFDHPTDTFLPGMKVNNGTKLISWSGPDDPGSGNYSFESAQSSYVIMRSHILYWRSRESSSFISFDRMDDPAAALLSNSTNSLVNNIPSRLVMNSSGKIQYFTWQNKSTQVTGWSLGWSEPRDKCSVFNACGNFATCNKSKDYLQYCKCLPDFEPTLPEKWNSGDFSRGCKRKLEICGDQDREGDTFLNLKKMRAGKPMDTHFFVAQSEEDCRKVCLSNCQCQAYSYNEPYSAERRDPEVHGCWIWITELYDLQEDYTEDGHNISVRVVSYSSEKKHMSISWKIAVTVMVVVFTALLLCSICFILYRKRMLAKIRGSRDETRALRLYETQRWARNLIGSGELKEDDKKGIDVPYFDLETILEATEYFSSVNKLGQGGFGPVYKGRFARGREIAVKRLSCHSQQGLEEFKNEVVLIAKLQHRNLVRLLGYCIKGDEQILLYEYMPNKSLDIFIFDRTLCFLLDWKKRFDIILGIARGLLYLHQDSRLRIIHRDLKTSNILLDEEMNPKISDFGLARIVGGKVTEANTNRVVGTYGYMSPEYALEGLFSVKSDVYSFGVILLEIVSGKRNTGFFKSQQAFNLLGHAWNLWTEKKTLDFMDVALYETCDEGEVIKCITVGLLCVQEDPSDRPTMPNVLFMLGCETATLPNPKQPAFISKKWLSSSSKPETVSIEGAR